MRDKKTFVIYGVVVIILMVFTPAVNRSWAVSTKITRHASGADFLKGKTENVVIDFQGTIQLGRALQVLVDKFENVWSINSIVISGGTVYIGTSPNGGIYKYGLGELTKIYPLQSDQSSKKNTAQENIPSKKPDAPQDNEPNDTEDFSDADKTEPNQYLSNEHIFAMSTDMSGRLLAGISGDKCRLCRLEANKMETIFEPNDIKYIFAIAKDNT